MITPRETLFVYKRAGIDTAEIRGRQVAAELGSDVLPLAELTAATGSCYAAIVYVKRAGTPGLLAELRRRGVRQVLDPLDDYSWIRIARQAKYLNAFIGATLTHALYLERRYGVPATEIPHHHCNIESQRIPWRNPPTIGFLSTPHQLKRNLALVKRFPHQTVTNVSRKGADGLQQLITSYLATDVGFAWRWDRNKLRFNCANKLTNFMSFGIPCVLTPESGYLQYGRHGVHCLYAHTKHDFLVLLKRLLDDPVLRQEMGEAGYEAARPFHISCIAETYREFLSRLE